MIYTNNFKNKYQPNFMNFNTKIFFIIFVLRNIKYNKLVMIKYLINLHNKNNHNNIY
jgi:hypothetical protein